MAIDREMQQEYIDTLTKEYMDKLFYFALKKTGDSYEAESLTSDILENILMSLERGNLPNHFHGWVWAVARNRYALWAKAKRQKCDLFAPDDLEEYDLPIDADPIEQQVAHQENLRLLRRELAFISADYRDIVVAHYIEDRRIREIAASLKLPESTVKSRLFRARSILKEGINMAREFGIRSYKPENVNFAASGSQPTNLPWRAVQRRLPKNVLLEADNNPVTVEQLAVELGIAMPYMEEEVQLLREATLLKQVEGDRYVTNFCIISRDAQEAIYHVLKDSSKKRSALLDTIVNDALPTLRELGIVRNGMSDNDLKWWALIFAVDSFTWILDGYDSLGERPARDNGETWGFMGFEAWEPPESLFVGMNGNGNKKSMSWTYKITDWDLVNRVGEMEKHQALFLGDVVKLNRKVTSFSESEKATWDSICGKFAHEGEDGSVVPDVLVLEGDVKDKCIKTFVTHPLAAQLKQEFQLAFDATMAVLAESIHEILKDEISYCASMMLTYTRMMAVRDAVEAGKLLVPENTKESTIAMWIEIE